MLLLRIVKRSQGSLDRLLRAEATKAARLEVATPAARDTVVAVTELLHRVVDAKYLSIMFVIPYLCLSLANVHTNH